MAPFHSSTSLQFDSHRMAVCGVGFGRPWIWCKCVCVRDAYTILITAPGTRPKICNYVLINDVFRVKRNINIQHRVQVTAIVAAHRRDIQNVYGNIYTIH